MTKRILSLLLALAAVFSLAWPAHAEGNAGQEIIIVEPSPEPTETPSPEPTKAPAALAAPKISKVENTETGVKLTWGKVPGASKYCLYYKKDGGDWTKMADTAETSYTWTKAKSGTKYSFRIRALDSQGELGSASGSKSLTYVAAPKVSKVENTATGVKVTWGKVTGASKYRLYYKKDGGDWKKITDTTKTSYTWTKAKGGKQYAFSVRAINSAGKLASAYGTGKSIVRLAAPELSGLENTKTGVKLSWGKVTGATYYRVYYKTAGGSWKKITDTKKTNYTWKKAKVGTEYTFSVRALSASKKSLSAYGRTSLSITRKNPSVSGNVTFTTSKGFHGETIKGVTYIEGYLIANKTYSLPKSYGSGLTGKTQEAFKTMSAAARKDGLNIYISSGFRSYSYQDTLYKNYVKRDGVKKADTYSARAGHSEHQSGLAFDVNIISDAFIGTPEAIWLADNCYKYGFILRYPQGKTNETGYKYEPWHFRYVGETLAKALYNDGDWITMEDYFGITSKYA